MDSVFSPLQTTVGHTSVELHRLGGDSNHPCTHFLDQKDVNHAFGFIIGERDITDGIHGLILQEANSINCSSSPVHPGSLEVDMDCTGEVGGNEELPRMGFSDQKDEALLSVFKNGKIGEYSTTHELGLPGRISSPYDDVDKQLKEIFVVSPPAHMAGARCCLPDTAEESSKVVDPNNLYKFSNVCVTYDEIFEIQDYFINCTVNTPKDARSQEALYRDIKHGRGLYAQYLGAKIRAGIGGSVCRILEKMEKDCYI